MHKPNTVEVVRQKLAANATESNGCLVWSGRRNKNGYGLIRLGKEQLAHRAAWIVSIGPIPPGMCVCHRCDNPSCVNPGHLFLGSQLENIADRDRKKRGVQLSGEKHGNSKLTEEQVLFARSSSISNRRLAALFGVSHGTIIFARKGATWRTLSHS